MFDFLFKRSAKPAAVPAPAAAPAMTAAAQAQAQAALRRAAQLATARSLAGDEAAAVALILESEFADVRLAGAEHVHSQTLLEQVYQAVRNTDRRVAKLVQGRLELLRHAQAEQQRAHAAIEQASRLLADEKFSPNQAAELDRQWLVIKAAPPLDSQFAALRAALAQRLEAQVRLQRNALDTLAELRRLPSASLDAAGAVQALARLAQAHALQARDPERASLPKQLAADFSVAHGAAEAAVAVLSRHQAAVDARHATLAAWQDAEPAALGAGAMQRAWRDLPALPEGELASQLQARFDALLATLPAPAVPAAPSPSLPEDGAAPAGKPARARAPAQPAAPAGADFFAALDALEAALAQGLLQVASEHDKALREMKPGRLTVAQAERLASGRAEFKRLADWARWGGNVSREELVKAADEMPGQGLPVGELAKKVGSLRERWKSLDSLSGPAPKSLWERFDAACSHAYAPAAAHFKQLSEERHGNAVKAQELVAEAQALNQATQASGADWKQLAATVQRLRQAWSRLGPLDRKDKKRLDGDFASALAALAAPLEQQQQLEIARREQLIAEVAQLQPMERSTLDLLRALQERWQVQARALPLERRIEQALWQRFRAACDAVFAERKESANAADHERREQLSAKEAVCATLESFVVPEGSDKAQIAAIGQALRAARAAWNGAGAVPRAAEAAIEQRYQAALAQVSALGDAITERADAAQANALRDRLRLCLALENAVAAAAPPAAGDALAERWRALPPLDAAYERATQARFAAAGAALADQDAGYAALLEANRSKLLDEVLRLEIVAGIDSGAQFARERLKMQVEVLQASLKTGQKPASQSTQWLALCALPALADERTLSRIDMLLRRTGTPAAAR